MRKASLAKIALCVACVTLSPLIAKYAAEYGDLSARLVSAYAENTPPPIVSSNGSIIMYKPGGQTEHITLSDEPPAEASATDTATDTEAAEATKATEATDTADTADTAADDYEARIIARNIAVHNESLGEINEADGVIAERVIHGNGGDIGIDEANAFAKVRNLTRDIPDSLLREQAGLRPDFAVDRTKPAVLILHTHTTEAYRQDESGRFSGKYGSRDGDPNKSVVAVGEAMALSIAKAGYTVIHDGTVHDNPYKGAYTRSEATTAQLLAQYPSIRIVLDVHRDAIEEAEADGTTARVSAVVPVDGRKAAQVMIITAADGGGYSVPEFRQNFRFACMLDRRVAARYGELARPVLFEHCGYNQDLAPGSLLVEIGSHGNSVGEAKYTGELVGGCVAEVLDSLVG